MYDLTLKKLISLFLIFTFLQLLISCENQRIRDKEYFYVDDDDRAWLIDTAECREFYISDSTGNFEKFVFDKQWQEFYGTKSSPGSFGLFNIDYNLYEYIHQKFLNSENEWFYIGIHPDGGFDGFELEIRFKNDWFRYDLLNECITSIRTEGGTRPTNDISNDTIIYLPINSEAIAYESMTINGITYKNVLEFVLKDFEDQWVSSTIVSFIIAKELGLIQYEFHNGTVCHRKL